MKYPQDDKMRSIDDILKIPHQRINIIGKNPDIDSATSPEDLWAPGGLWVPPDSPNQHDIKSDDAADTGSLIAQGNATAGGKNNLVNSGADFIASGVQVDDVILNDSTSVYSVITSVSQTILVFESTDNSPAFNQGDLYRVVRSGAGASVLCLDYLTGDFLQQRKFYILNGTATVQTDELFRINGAFICGSGDRFDVNLGTISISDSINSTITDQILPSDGVSSTAVLTVPSNYTAYISSISASILEVTNAGASVALSITRFSKTGKNGSQHIRLFDLSASGGNTATRKFVPTLIVPELTDIIIRCASVSTNNVNVSGNFSTFLVKNA